jgi:anaerobic selenocysteine-containing dehydrogenase
MLQEGATWIDDVDPKAAPPKLDVAALSAGNSASAFPLAVAVTEPDTPVLVSPLLSKVYQESNLRLAPEGVALHPSDARAAGLESGSRARLETACGSAAVDVTVDPAVPPGMVQISGGPGIRKICGASARARVVRS